MSALWQDCQGILEDNGKKKRYINEKRSGDIIPAVFCIDRILRFKHFLKKYLGLSVEFCGNILFEEKFF